MIIKKRLISDDYLNDGKGISSIESCKKEMFDQLLSDHVLETYFHKQCPICSHDHAILISEKDRHGIPLDTVICDACGLIYSLSIYTPAAMSYFYLTYYRQLFDNNVNYDGTLNESLHDYYNLKGSYTIRNYVKSNAVVLDLGCGGGWALLPYHKAGFTYYGFDYNGDYIDFGKKHYNLNLFLGGVAEAKEMSIKADYLFMSHVLEHTPDPVSFLKSLKPLLNENALVNIAVPSVNFMWFGGGGIGTRLLETLQIAHTVLFDEVTLRYVAQKAGFSILNCIGGNMVLKYSSEPVQLPKPLQNRGLSVLRKIQFFEKTPWRVAFIPAHLKEKAHYLHYLFCPIKAIQKMMLKWYD